MKSFRNVKNLFYRTSVSTSQNKNFSVQLTLESIQTKIDKNSQIYQVSIILTLYQENFRSSLSLLENLKSRITKNIYGGGKAVVDRHRGRGKLLPRERINKIIDPG